MGLYLEDYWLTVVINSNVTEYSSSLSYHAQANELNEPPYFEGLKNEAILPKHEHEFGTQTTYTLPGLADDQGDDVSITFGLSSGPPK